MKTLSRIAILFIITLVVASCTYEDENEELKIETTNNSKLTSTGEKFNILIRYREDSTNESRIAIRNKYFTDCSDPYTAPCSKPTAIKLGPPVFSYNPYLEYWTIEICNINFNDPDCEGGLISDIESEEGVVEVIGN